MTELEGSNRRKWLPGKGKTLENVADVNDFQNLFVIPSPSTY